MGYPWLKAETKARVRRSNQMVLKALKRGQGRPPWYTMLLVGRAPSKVLDVGVQVGEGHGAMA